MVQERNALRVGQVPPPPSPAAPPEEQLNYIANQLHRLVEIGEQLTGQGPIVIQPTQAAIVMDPDTILDFIRIVSPPGKVQVWSVVLPVAVGAGATVQYGYRLPSGWVSVMRSPIVHYSDFYSPLLTIEAWAEEDRRPVTFGAMPMTDPTTIDIQFMVKRWGFDWEFVNASAFNALVSITLSAFWLEKSYYEDFYKPLIDKIYAAAEGLLP